MAFLSKESSKALVVSRTARYPGVNRRSPQTVPITRIVFWTCELAFAEEGFAGAKMRNIADTADVNQALIRYYFGSKEEFLDDVRPSPFIAG